MSDPMLYVDGVSLADFGYAMNPAIVGLRDTADRTPETIVVPRRAGGVFTGAETVGFGRFAPKGIVRAASAADLLVKIDQLKALLGGGLHTFRTIDTVTRTFQGYVTSLTFTFYGPDLIARDATMDLTVQRESYQLETPVVPIGFSEDRSELPLGNAPSGWIIEAYGEDDYLYLDSDAQVRLYRSGVLDSILGGAIQYLAADSYFHALQPTRDGLYPNGPWPTMELEFAVDPNAIAFVYRNFRGIEVWRLPFVLDEPLGDDVIASIRFHKRYF